MNATTLSVKKIALGAFCAFVFSVFPAEAVIMYEDLTADGYPSWGTMLITNTGTPSSWEAGMVASDVTGFITLEDSVSGFVYATSTTEFVDTPYTGGVIPWTFIFPETMEISAGISIVPVPHIVSGSYWATWFHSGIGSYGTLYGVDEDNLITITDPYGDIDLAVSTTTYDVAVDYSASSTATTAVSVYDSAGICDPAQTVIIPISSGTLTFACPVSLVSPTTFRAFITHETDNGAMDILPLAVSDPVTVYSYEYAQTFGLGASSTLAEYALVGCNQATSSPSFTDLGGQLKRAMCWAFVPKVDLLPDWGGMGDTLGGKPPFGYFSVLNSGLAGMTASGTPAYTLMSTTTQSDFSGIFTPIRTGFVWIIWLAGALWLWRRASEIQT